MSKNQKNHYGSLRAVNIPDAIRILKMISRIENLMLHHTESYCSLVRISPLIINKHKPKNYQHKHQRCLQSCDALPQHLQAALRDRRFVLVVDIAAL